MDKIEQIRKLFQNYQLISLGYCCYPKCFIDMIIEKKQTLFFDWIASSTWSIIALLENNFYNVVNRDNYYYWNEPFIPHSPFHYIYNKEYYLRFIHDDNFLNTNEEWDNFKNKYIRRVERFNELLTSKHNLLFFYLEENIFRYNSLYPEIKKYYPKNIENYHIEQSKLEQERMLEIVKIIKNKYHKHNFKIIYFSHMLEKTKYTENIIFIKTDDEYTSVITDASLGDLSQHYTMIDQRLQKWKKQCIKCIIENFDFINNILNSKP